MPSLISISRDGSTFRFVCDVLILLGEAKYTFDGSVKLGYTYQYDAMDRITEVRKSGSPNSQYLEYEYDALGQLVSATDYAAGLEYTYTFDTAGNVLSAVKHPTSGGSASTRTYHYDNASWRDLLTSITIDGTTKEISYPHDIRGNITAGTPLSWYNGNEFTLTWGKGTQLASAKKGLALKTSYDYDIAGVRSSKTVGTTKYKFTTLSGLVMRQEWGARQMDFVYDENNQPYALSYKSGKNVTPVMYYYLLNQQGDVEALMDANGAIVATYEYDPWGAVTVKNANGALDNDDTSIGNMNPLRYRGYYYDNETGFYYLESRYYDPVVGRFISPDTFASTDITDALSANMFAYCNNDPVNYKDDQGSMPIIAAALINGVISAGFTAVTVALDAQMSGETLSAKELTRSITISFAMGALSTVAPIDTLVTLISIGDTLISGIGKGDKFIDIFIDVVGTFVSCSIAISVNNCLKNFNTMLVNLIANIASFNFDSLYNIGKALRNIFKTNNSTTSKTYTSNSTTSKTYTSNSSRNANNIPTIHALGAC